MWILFLFSHHHFLKLDESQQEHPILCSRIIASDFKFASQALGVQQDTRDEP